MKKIVNVEVKNDTEVGRKLEMSEYKFFLC